MAKKPIKVTICDKVVELRWCDPHYYLGDIGVNGSSFHVEAIAVNENGDAKNNTYQCRIDKWAEANENGDYERVEIDGREYFVNIEAFCR